MSMHNVTYRRYIYCYKNNRLVDSEHVTSQSHLLSTIDYFEQKHGSDIAIVWSKKNSWIATFKMISGYFIGRNIKEV
jgi:hypothetical protein